VLLEIETDKASIDVEAQDDGVMGKIIAEAGTSKIPVGQIIAMLAEEGDDLSAIEVPKDLAPEGSAAPEKTEAEAPKAEAAEPKAEQKEETHASGSAPSPSEPTSHEHKEINHPKPLFPSVARLLLDSTLTSEQISKLKGTGRHGMLTKGDVLLAMGKIKSAYGSAETLNLDTMGASGRRKSESKATEPVQPQAEKAEVLDGPALRRLILAGMQNATRPLEPIVPHVSTPLPLSSDAQFDDILAPYSSLMPPPQPKLTLPTADVLAEMGAHASHSSTTRARASKQDDIESLF